jgi:hypothetical protein
MSQWREPADTPPGPINQFVELGERDMLEGGIFGDGG